MSIEFIKMCYVPDCKEEGTIESTGGSMCKKHYHAMIGASIRMDAYYYGIDTEEGQRLLAEADKYDKENLL